jgi:hypothetical protein
MSRAWDKEPTGPGGLLYGTRRRVTRYQPRSKDEATPVGFGLGLVEWLRLSDGVRHRVDGPAVEIAEGAELVMPCHHREAHSDECVTVYGPAGLHYRDGIWGSPEQPGLVLEAGGRWEDFLGDVEIYGPAKLWYVNGQLNRADGPAVQGGNAEHWFRHGRAHREDGPASTWEDGTRVWYWDGSLHRIDGPAIEYANGPSEWWRRDVLHRNGGPAVVVPDRVEDWLPDMHNFASTGWLPSPHVANEPWFIDGPAEIWIRDGRFHRDDGPAVVGPSGRREFWLEGERLSERSFARR